MPAQSQQDYERILKSKIFAEIRQVEETFSDYTDEKLDQYMFRNRYTVRLSKDGLNLMVKHFYGEAFELDEKMSGRDLIALKRKMIYPYYLDRKKMHLFSGKDIFTIKILGKHLKKWISKFH